MVTFEHRAHVGANLLEVPERALELRHGRNLARHDVVQDIFTVRLRVRREFCRNGVDEVALRPVTPALCPSLLDDLEERLPSLPVHGRKSAARNTKLMRLARLVVEIVKRRVGTMAPSTQHRRQLSRVSQGWPDRSKYHASQLLRLRKATVIRRYLTACGRKGHDGLPPRPSSW